MCLVAFALARHARYPLVLAANRDEYHDRAAQPMHWWTPAHGGHRDQPVLAGRDVASGGTWLGLNAQGRLALLTNVRRAGGPDLGAPSRGAVVPLWLHGGATADHFWRALRGAGHNPFNVVTADLARGEWHWAQSGVAEPRALGPGLYGVSNAALDTDWPKVRTLKTALDEALADDLERAALEARLLAALADPQRPDDAALPDTGVPLDWERALSSRFIRMPEHRYGTRCSTLVIADGGALHVLERSFDAHGDATGDRRFTLPMPA